MQRPAIAARTALAYAGAMISKVRNLNNENRGVLYAVIAHLFWGAMAGYLGMIRYINPMEIAVHRALWSIPIGAAVAWWLGQLPAVWAILRNGKLKTTKRLVNSNVSINLPLRKMAQTAGNWPSHQATAAPMGMLHKAR